MRDLRSDPAKETTASPPEIAPVPHLRHQHLETLLPDLLALLDDPPEEGTVAELGVLAGGSSGEIRTRNQPRRLLLLDSFVTKGDRLALVSERFKNQIQDGRGVFREGHSWDELAKLEDRSLDWIYIDADHDEVSALRDLGINITLRAVIESSLFKLLRSCDCLDFVMRRTMPAKRVPRATHGPGV